MSRREKAEHIRHIMATEGDAIGENTRTINQLSRHAIEQLDAYEDLRTEARSSKEAAIERLPELLDEVTEAVEANGGTVYLAQDVAAANRYVECCGMAGSFGYKSEYYELSVDVGERLVEELPAGTGRRERHLLL
jgi:L-lactate utilization protein LutB